MSVNQVITDLVHGDVNFCCLCLRETAASNTAKSVWIHDDIMVDSQDTQPMSTLINSILGEDVLSTVSAFGLFCNKCKTSIVNNYKFQKMCKENLTNLISIVNSLSESFENVIPDLEDYKSFFVSIDVKDFTSKQFYDNEHLDNASAAYHRLCSTANHKPKLCKQQESLTLKNIDNLKICGKTINKKKRINREPNIVDIPSVPTKHMIADNNSSFSFTCGICCFKFTEESKLRWHFFKKHYQKGFKCTKCPRSFITNEMLKKHEDDFHCDGVCTECGKHFTNKYVLRKHEMNHRIQVTCDECGRVYRSVEAYKKHITDDVCRQKCKKSADQATFQCDYCNKRYCYKPYLAKHIMHEHCNAVGFCCEFCKKQFYTQSRLKTHLVKHTREKRFVCSLCNGKFVTRESLLYHTRLHTGEKPYQCDYCDLAFLSASRRLDHERRHHLPPSLECDICHVKFKATGSLLKHRKRHFNPSSKLSTYKNSYTLITTGVKKES